MEPTFSARSRVPPNAAHLDRWVKNKDDKRQALTNGMTAVGDKAAKDMRASRIIDPHDKGPPAPRPVR